MIYRVAITEDAQSSENQGYRYFASRRDALKVAASYRRHGGDAEVTAFDVPRTKAGLLALLNKIAAHADNG